MKKITALSIFNESKEGKNGFVVYVDETAEYKDDDPPFIEWNKTDKFFVECIDITDFMNNFEKDYFKHIRSMNVRFDTNNQLLVQFVSRGSKNEDYRMHTLKVSMIIYNKNIDQLKELEKLIDKFDN
jgi:hypothetical protein